ncbi:MAG: hypothetical protein A2Z99_19140 [Treponema sp. GWB1_62_6]|nr:MAG: hypothetical protein A2Y36_03705 [Treponema sp. GWA1_62_8]OHE66595.1 MAG: hypothetical protein A2001_15160 [Treponema sp. GWC1_61_84]OHE67651.1 MAG: hypothetical protein A2Z99_19140 [Treponema sp. GWB1_62_6]OHE72280.1 MAG: hypothetical protein A2413_14835 [Treponema sp. RIFOXYC1_FULL_61_9]HCM28269.1 hypothetical protein [Treponema sp.]
MYVHAKQREFDEILRALFEEVDRRLEDRWPLAYARHPNRPERGVTADPSADGLFEVAADFTAGIGSGLGRGYLVSVRVATLEDVPVDRFEAFMTEAAGTVSELLPRYFPGRELGVARDGPRFKITGDFSLGSL